MGKLNTSDSNDRGKDQKIEYSCAKPGTAYFAGQRKNLLNHRLYSAKTNSRRPESRYKKESLYNKLDFEGCASTKECYIPILQCGYDAHIEGIMPDCWKNDKLL